MSLADDYLKVLADQWDAFLSRFFRAKQASTAAVTSVASSASAVTLLAANAERKSALFFNDSTATLYLKFGVGAAPSSFTVKIAPGGYADMSDVVYTDIITGVWDAANGYCNITELT